MSTEGVKIIAKNKQAYHLYDVKDKYEAGIELVGTEVKSVRGGKVNLKDSWVSIDDGEAFVKGMHISPYEMGNIFNKDPLRKRKLLLHKQEINKLHFEVMKEGYSLVPLSLYFKKSKIKLEFALAKGKKLYDKREAAAKKDSQRDMDRAVKENAKY
ncbi:MAG: SsrA-binding protein SmpB [Clostridia bacterium]|nr:SsrA-binding protein SmpB [Clostridia bacterium]